MIIGLVAWGLLVPAGMAAAAPAGMASTSTITLLTGDKVTLVGPRGATVRPARGRERIGFHQSKDVHGDIHVVPDDAMPMLRADRIDPRLFNVTQLAENGYDDTKSKDIPLIVSGIPNLTAATVRALPSIQSAAIRIDKAIGLPEFTSAGSNNPTRPPAPPGAATSALTVGAVDHNDQLAEFSTRGPRFGDDLIKPEITAPGVDIAAAKATHGQAGDPVDPTHVRMPGTSMATPHVADAAAILAGQHPSRRADRIKSALMGSAKPHPALSVFEQGAGRLDVARAVTQTVQAEPASLNAGVAQWPHHDDVPITKTLTYHNSGATAVDATMTTDIRDPAGNPVPAGMFTFSPNTITIPAGGQAQAEHRRSPQSRVSHDDGTTWKPVPVLTAGGKWFTILIHPAGAKSVSLKASVSDSDGNSVDQTILRAFHLK